jgi:predicted RNA-binding Zn ribbon-like protein
MTPHDYSESRKAERQDSRPFDLSAGNAALDLINTLDDRFMEAGPLELLTSYDDLLRFAVQSQLLTERQAKKLKRSETTQAERTQVLERVKDLREALAEATYARLDGQEIPEASVALLEEHFKQAALHRHLAPGEVGLSWEWRGLGRSIDAPWWLLAQAASDLLLSAQAAQIRLCASDTCRWLFLDTSKNHTRRWCNMRVCGNRMKARRFHARRADSV